MTLVDQSNEKEQGICNKISHEAKKEPNSDTKKSNLTITLFQEIVL